MKNTRSLVLHVLLNLFCLCVLQIASAQKQITISSIKNAGIVTLTSATEWQKISAAKLTAPVQVVVKSNAPLTANQLKELGERMSISSYLPDNTYIGYISNPLPANISSNLYLAEIKPQWKADGYTWQLSKSTNKNIDIVVTIYKAVSLSTIKQKLTELGGQLIDEHPLYSNAYKVTIPANKFNFFANWYAVEYITLLSTDELLDVESQNSAKANIVAASSVFGGFGLSGKDVTIGVGDNTSGNFHIDLKDRIVNYNPTGYSNHGVHINGIIAGAGIIDYKGEGIAPRASLINHLYSNVWAQTPEMRTTYNMTLTNNSYASVVGNCGYAGTYDVYSQMLDQQAFDFPDVLHTFAAGNDGYLDCQPYPKGFATINGGFQPAKNIIVVTSTDKKYVNAIDGSRGPIKDGRLKPEMTAIGVDVNSTTRSEQYLIAGGTSMACPEVTGALALLTERYKQLNSNANPRGDVLKTLILNGAMDIGNPGPDYRFGFGFLNLYRSLLMLNNAQYSVDSIENSQQKTQTITVPPNTAQLKVMLCWNDVPASPMSTAQLVNDLDIEVATPNANIHLPLILDPSPANVLNNAVEGVDKRNNCEQVTINQPIAGNYVITVKGSSITTPRQRYIVAYDIVPEGLMLGFPNAGSQVNANDSIHVYWDASPNTNSFSLEFSTDGTNWTMLDNNIPPDQRYYMWHVADGINSGTCKMRITRNSTSQVYTSGAFVVNQQLKVALDTIQCPGYIHIMWNSLPGISNYQVLRKIGAEMIAIDTVTATDYTVGGLSPDSVYYMAVRPIVNGLAGYRSLAVKRQPNDGSCKGSISNGDMRANILLSPRSGRKYTSTQLTSSEPIVVQVQNLDDVPTNYYKISYSINNTPWQSQVSNTPILATGKLNINLGTVDMSATGNYTIKVAITNLLEPDPIPGNDTIVAYIQHLNNEPISVNNTYLQSFEDMGIVNTTTDTLGITPDEHWDYRNNTADSGRLRSFINTDLPLQGVRSISLDVVKNRTIRTQNELLGTFNLTGHKADEDEIRLEFNYRLHGLPDSMKGNEVWVRGNDQQEWESIYTYKISAVDVGNILSSGTLSITDGLLKAEQDYSSSFQVRFGQRDTTLIAGKNYGCGVTIDDIKLYTVQNDVQLNAVVTPGIIDCGLDANSPLIVAVYNSVNQDQQNISISYRLDGGTTVIENIPQITGKQKIQYTFTNSPNLSAPGQHTLDVWLTGLNDSYKTNDSILNYSFYNQPLITFFPYKEDFENSDGSWFTGGTNSSWQWGEPASEKINKAASGSKVWKTNLHGNYNDNELSYLYSPCFDLTNMTNPVLSLKIAYDIENCGFVLCDGSLVEYSVDGIKWDVLGTSGKGINWYNDTLYNIWSQEDKTNWMPASFDLPPLNTIVKLRMLFFSDIAANSEGIAIDDVEITDNRMYPSKQLISVSPNPTTDGRITLEWTGNAQSKLEIVMTDIMGKEVYRTTAGSKGNYNKTIFQTSRFNTGMYFMRIHIDDRKYNYKIIYN